MVSPRIKKGLQWAKSVLLFVSILSGVKVFFALDSAAPGQNLVTAIILFLGGCILLCPLAFILGWLTGSKEKAESEALPNQEAAVTESIKRKSNLWKYLLFGLGSGIVLLLFYQASTSKQITCEQFVALSPKDQAIAYRDIIAVHVGTIESSPNTSRAKALKFIQNNNQLIMVVGGVLGITQEICSQRKNEKMDAVAIEQMNDILDLISKNNGL